MATNLSLHLDAAPQRCPMCDGELYVTKSEPRSGASCPFCRGPLWFLQKTVDDIMILTFLSDGKHKGAASGWSDATFWSLKNTSRAIIDLSRLSTVSDAFLEMILAIHQRLKSGGGELKVCGLASSVAQAFEDADMNAVIAVYADQDAALRSFEQSEDADPLALPLIAAPLDAGQAEYATQV